MNKLDGATHSVGCHSWGPRHYACAEARIERLEEALRTIQKWDCLNPPRTDLFGDANWLRKIVDDAIGLDTP